MRVFGVYGLLLLATVFWGLNFVLAGFVLTDFSPTGSAAWRFGGAAVILLVWVVMMPATPRLWLVLRSNAWRYLLLGIIGISGFNLLFFEAMRTASADTAALIMATNPLLTTFLAWMVLGEHPGWQRLLALPVALAGVLVVITEGHLGRLFTLSLVPGDALMLAADVCWAFYNVLTRLLMPKSVSAPVNTAFVVTAGALVLLGVAAMSSPVPVNLSPTAGWAMIVMIVFGTVLAYLFWNTGIAALGAGRTALFMNLVPVFAMLSAMGFGQMPTPGQWLGGAIVFAGLLLSVLPDWRVDKGLRSSV
ncbi:DMT family transporter [Halothiobacillus sp. DCM-1]|uniref:DMT family transporter n=1 Tax=Halothiobacillus sp. DCM-1 TaxID=3112558 RepID=UPI003244C64C